MKDTLRHLRRTRLKLIALAKAPFRPRQTAPRAPQVASGILRGPRFLALVAITILIVAASAVSFAESYRGLYLWAIHHGLTGIWAAAFPAQIDVFIAVGELALFVALVDQWQARQRGAAWMVTLAGLGVSVAGNIGHVTSHAFAVRATAAIPPLAAASALAVGLGVLKRVVEKRQRESTSAVWSPVPGSAEAAAMASLRATLAAGNPWSGRQIEARFGLSRAQAAKVRELVIPEPSPEPSLNGDSPHV